MRWLAIALTLGCLTGCAGDPGASPVSHEPAVAGQDTFSAADPTTGATNSSVTVEASRDSVLVGDCSRAVLRRDGSADAIRTCRAAVAAAEELSAVGSYERRAANGLLAEVYMLGGRWDDAIAQYETVRNIAVQSDDAYRAAESLGMVAVAHANRGDLAAADRAFASAVTETESAMAEAEPAHRELYAGMLRTLLHLHAGLERQRGNEPAAAALDRRAEAVRPGK